MRHTVDRVVLIQHNITTMTNKIINIYKVFKYVQFTYRVALQPHKYSIPNIIRVCSQPTIFFFYVNGTTSPPAHLIKQTSSLGSTAGSQCANVQGNDWYYLCFDQQQTSFHYLSQKLRGITQMTYPNALTPKGYGVCATQGLKETNQVVLEAYKGNSFVFV